MCFDCDGPTTYLQSDVCVLGAWLDLSPDGWFEGRVMEETDGGTEGGRSRGEEGEERGVK